MARALDAGAHRFERRQRVRKRAEYLAIQSTGRKLGGQHFVLLVAQGSGRLGITVSKKVGNAVTRNRVKRFVREFARLARDATRSWLPADRDVVVIARASAAALDSHAVSADLLRLGARL